MLLKQSIHSNTIKLCRLEMQFAMLVVTWLFTGSRFHQHLRSVVSIDLWENMTRWIAEEIPHQDGEARLPYFWYRQRPHRLTFYCLTRYVFRPFVVIHVRTCKYSYFHKGITHRTADMKYRTAVILYRYKAQDCSYLYTDIRHRTAVIFIQT